MDSWKRTIHSFVPIYRLNNALFDKLILQNNNNNLKRFTRLDFSGDMGVCVAVEKVEKKVI